MKTHDELLDKYLEVLKMDFQEFYAFVKSMSAEELIELQIKYCEFTRKQLQEDEQ